MNILKKYLEANLVISKWWDNSWWKWYQEKQCYFYENDRVIIFSNNIPIGIGVITKNTQENSYWKWVNYTNDDNLYHYIPPIQIYFRGIKIIDNNWDSVSEEWINVWDLNFNSKIELFDESHQFYNSNMNNNDNNAWLNNIKTNVNINEFKNLKNILCCTT